MVAVQTNTIVPFQPLRIGNLVIWPPVVLAPMAGVTDVAFRHLVSEFGKGLLVSEMVSASLLTQGNQATRNMVQFFPGEAIRSVQLYGTKPEDVYSAIVILKKEFGIHHLDLNFGCPMPKVTRKGGGAALPLHATLFPAILDAAVTAAGDIPVTIKIRMGLDDDWLYGQEVAELAVQKKIAAITLHARTAAQFYGGTASWKAIRELVEQFPNLTVVGNGDIWTAQHAIQMLIQTGCQGVGIGRAILGRPFLFRHLKQVFSGQLEPRYPDLKSVAAIARRHMELMVHYFPEKLAIRRFRKHLKWYFQGFSPAVQRQVHHLLQLEEAIAVERGLQAMKSMEPYPMVEIWSPRGRSRQQSRVVLPTEYRQRLASGDFVVQEVTVAGGG